MKKDHVEKNILIEIKNLNYFYSKNEQVLKDISIKIYKGEKIVILGANGAGKSTFFLNLNGVLQPNSGSIYYNKQEITKSKKDLLKLRKNIGIVFQDPDNQIVASTVFSEISFGPINLKLPKNEVLERVENALEYMNLTKYRDRPPHYLSGGEKKRVSIADIIAMNPEVILFDEPTASLDPINVEILEDVLNRLEEKGVTMLISTHDVNFAYRWADRVVVFANGQIIADGNPIEIFNDTDVLKRANLNKPILFDVYNKLCENNIHLKKAYPKDINEFEEAITNIKE